MPDFAVTKKWPLLGLMALLMLGLGYRFLEKPITTETAMSAVHKLTDQQTKKPTKQASPQPIASLVGVEKVPEAITPEGIKALISDNKPYLLVNADDPNPQTQIQGPIRVIYYNLNPSYRSAQTRVNKDREIDPNDPTRAIKPVSQRLTGTPLEWKRLGLPFQPTPIFEQPLKISPKQLSESIKDNVDLQIIDLRPVTPGDAAELSFPQVLRWMPHEVLTNVTKLSKEKWTVLVGIGNEDAQPIAFELSQKGYALTTVLEGGYPAWVNATDR
jgi:hypothetical protein